MKPSSIFGLLALTASALIGVAACSQGTAPQSPLAPSGAMIPDSVITPTPAPRLLYVVRNGVFSEYALPLKRNARALRTLDVTPGHPAVSEAIAVDQFGRVAIATSKEIRVYRPPIRTFARTAATLILPLTPAITEVGQTGADLADVEFDHNGDLWLLNNLGGDVSMLAAPISRRSVSTLNLQFGVTGTQTAGFGNLLQARFDVNSTLYVLASNANVGAHLFKVGFPYAKPPSGFYNLDLAAADFVDASQFPYGPPAGAGGGVILGQYYGPLHGSPPLKPTPMPTNVLAQFNQPIVPQLQGVFPNATTNKVVGALVADPPRNVFYTLDQFSGALDVYKIPLANHAKPLLTFPCTGGPKICQQQPERLFVAP